MKFKSLEPIFHSDSRWNSIDDKEKEEEFQKYLEKLFLEENKIKDKNIELNC